MKGKEDMRTGIAFLLTISLLMVAGCSRSDAPRQDNTSTKTGKKTGNAFVEYENLQPKGSR